MKVEAFLMTSSELEHRQALPDGIAHLLPTYPQATWQAHHGFGEMARRWLTMHRSLRESGSGLLGAAQAFRDTPDDVGSFYQAFRPLAAHHYQHLEGHHQIEDSVLFPQFRQLDSRMQSSFDLLENDHEIIHESLVSSADSINRLIRSLATGGDGMRFVLDEYLRDAMRLNRLVDRHLEDEEEIIVPALLHHGESAFL